MRTECVTEAVVFHEMDGIRGAFRFDRTDERRAARAWLTEQSNRAEEAAA